MPSRRIAHVLPWPSVGGTEVATVRLAMAVEGSEYASVAFVPRGGHAVRSLFERAGIAVVEYDAPEPSYRHLRSYLSRSRALASQFRAARVDAVHCADLLAAFRCGLGALLAGVPVITHVRGRVPEISRRDATFYWPVRRFVFVSREAQSSFALRLRRGRGIVLHDGIELVEDTPHVGREVRAELGIPPSASVIGMVARVAAAKDYPTLIAAAADVVRVHPAALFLIVGQRSGVPEYVEHFAYVCELLDAAGLTSRFLFTDHRDDVGRLIWAMDLCVLASHGEGLPLVILEAMARGKPFVATDVGGIPEIIQDGETGLLVPRRDAPALARALLGLLDDPARARRLGAAGREHVARHFSRSAFAASLRALYHDVLGNRAGVSGVAPRS